MTGTKAPAGVVVVGVAGESDGDRAAVGWAAAEAQRRRAALVLLHASGAGGDGSRSSDGPLAAAKEWAAPSQPVEVLAQTVGGRPDEALLAWSLRAALVVVGRAGTSGRHHLGSTASTVAAQTPCPVVVIGPDPASGRSGVAAGVSARHRHDEVVRLAVRSARAQDEALTLITAWRVPPPAAPYPGYSGPTPTERRAAAAAADQAVREAALIARAADAAIEVRTESVEGDPDQAILDASGSHALLVIGRHGEHHVGSYGLGRVARTALARSLCPVMVVPTDSRRQAERVAELRDRIERGALAG